MGHRSTVAVAATALCLAISMQAGLAASFYFKNSKVPRLPPVPPEFRKFVLPPSKVTMQEYHREMGLLHISAMRSPRDARDPDAANAANYDPALANPYPRPSQVLREEGGAWVTTPAVWWAERRPEIVNAAEEWLFGHIPDGVPSVTWRVTGIEKEMVEGVAAITEHVVGHVDNSSYPSINIDIPLDVTLPANVSGRVPVIIEFGSRQFKMPAHLPPEVMPSAHTPPPYGGPTGHGRVLATGWGYALLDISSIQADNGGDLTKGIIGLVNKGQPRKMDDWGALRAWAWGASRALDYLRTDSHVAPDEIGITGHSRAGKAALVAMAFDQRFAIAFISSSGEGGSKLWRRNYGETVTDIAAPNEFHWMAGNFLKYAAAPLTANDMPVDGDALIALCAPRPVFISAGNPEAGEAWVDAKGQFMAAVGAGPVYRLLGRKPLQTDRFPAMGTALIAGDIGFRQHQYGHMALQGPNWPTFIGFAHKYLRVEQ